MDGWTLGRIGGRMKSIDILFKNIAKKLQLDYVHPIGTIYTTTSANFDPNNTWGGMAKVNG